ncbi:uncharacterized protein LOC127862411 isoform X2 [Dreissena polymorpha]|uniref:uncharacterized protein LOC127862411 isoform X2 n=1 Tax=Dreissena polymorpha TaxID=45954 RepID=UPI0022644906|nr:uncharacterized protein LOC127862411 isoform X2 [Dreissena polymorpha]
MRVFFLLAVAYAVCQMESQVSASDTSYSVGKEYVYDYETQAITGFPKGGKIWSGLRVSSQVIVQVSAADRLIVQLISPQVSKLNEEVDAGDPRQELLPSELFQELSDADTERLNQDLRKPVTVKYMRGHVQELATEMDDPDHSLDIKRGLISLLELNFNERQSLDSDRPVIRDDGKPVIYRVIEPSVSGDCETTYRLSHNRSLDGDLGMDILKVRHLDSCVDTVVTRAGILEERPCRECNDKHQQESLCPSSSVRYSLLGSPDQFVIISATTEVKYIAAPYPDLSASPATYTRQSLNLMVSRPITIQIQELHSSRHHERPLKAQGSSRRKAGHSLENRDALVQKCTELLKGLDHLIKDGVKDGAGDVQMELYTLLQQLDRTGIESLMDQTRSSKARKSLIDLLSTAGTYASVDYLLEIMDSGKLDSVSASLVLARVGHFPKPDVSVVSRILEFIRIKVQKLKTDNPVLRRAAWLCLGALGNKLVESNAEKERELLAQEKITNALRSDANDVELRKRLDRKLEEIRHMKRQQKELYDTEVLNIEKMVKQLMSQEDSDSQRLGLKVVGALGYESLLDTLGEVIRDRSHGPLKRLLAIASTEKIASVAPSKVLKLLLGVFYDRTEPDDIRIIAYLTSLAAKPDQSDLELVARSLEDEPSLNVGSLVYASLLELSMTSKSCLENSSRNISLALRYAKIIDSQEQRSKISVQSSYDKDLGVGFLRQLVVVGVPEESFPRVVSVKVSPSLLARNSDMLEIGMVSQGIDSLYEDILANHADTELQTLAHMFLHARSPRSTSIPEQRVADIKKKVGVKPVEPVKLEGHVYVKVFGQEALYLDLESIAAVTSLGPSQGEGKQGETFSILRFLKAEMGLLDSLKDLLHSQFSFAVPLVQLQQTTESGLPLRAELHLQGISSLQGSFGIQENPRKARSGPLISRWDAFVDMKPSLFVQAQPRLGVQLKHITSGLELPVTISLDLPVSAVVNVDPEKSKLLISFKDQKPVRAVSIEARMFTVISMDPTSLSAYDKITDRREIIAVEGADITKISTTIGDIFGRSLTLEGEIRSVKDQYSPLLLYSGRQFVQLKFQPLSPADLNVQFQHVQVLQDDATSYEDMGDSSDGGGGWLSSMYNWLYPGKRSRNSRPDKDSHTSDGSGDAFLNIAEKDLSIDYLTRKFEKDTPIYSSGSKCGLVLRIADAGTRPQYETQLSTLYQREPTGQISYTAEFKQAQRKAKKQPWRIVADIKLDVPKQDIAPSDLFSSVYLKQLQDQIKVAVTENGEKVDSLLDLVFELRKEASVDIREQAKPSRLDNIIDGAVSQTLLRSTDSHLERSIQRQRELKKEIKYLNKKSLTVISVKADLRSLRDVIGKSVKNIEAVEKGIDGKKHNEQSEEDSVQALYVIAKERGSLKILDKISKKLQSLISLQEVNDLFSQVKDLRRKVAKVQEKIEQQCSARLSHEKVSISSLSTEDRGLHDSVEDIDRQLTSLTALQDQEKKFSDDDGENSKVVLSDVFIKAAKVRDDVDEKLLQDSQMDKRLSARLTEVLLKMKMATEDIDYQVQELNKNIGIRDMTKPPVDIDKKDRQDVAKHSLSSRNEEVRKVAKQLAERLHISIEEDSERESLTSEQRGNDQASIKSLIKQRILQLKSLESIEEILESSFEKQEVSSDQFKQIIKDASKSKSALSIILEMEIMKIKVDKRIDLSPILIGAVKSIGRLSEIMGKLKQVISLRVKDLAVRNDAEIQIYEALETDVDKTQMDLDELINRVKSVLRESRKISEEAGQEGILSERSNIQSRVRSEAACSQSAILKQALKVESRQLGVKFALASVMDMLSGDNEHEERSKKERASQDTDSFKVSKSAQETSIKERSSKDTSIRDKNSQYRPTAERASQYKSSQDRAGEEKSIRDKDSQEKPILDSARQDRASEEKSIRDKDSQEKPSMDSARQDRASEEKSIRDKDSQEKPTQDRARQDRASEEKSIRDKDSQVKPSQNMVSQEKHIKNKDSLDQPSQDRARKDRARQDESIRDRDSQDKSSKDIDSPDQPSQARDSQNEDRASQHPSLSAQDKARKDVQLKQLIYEVMSQLQAAQDDLDSIHSAILKHSDPSYLACMYDFQSLDRLVQRIVDIQAQQISLVESFEEGLQHSPSSSLIRIQQLRDRILRQNQDIKALQVSLKAAQTSSKQKDDGRGTSEDLLSRSIDGDRAPHSRDQRAESRISYHREMTGAIKIRYGVENGRDKLIKIQLIAQKSLEQLLWERKQLSPLKRDPLVLSYLDDQRRRDDITSPYYEPLRLRLNTLRHVHILAAYEGGIGESVRELGWKTQVLIKLMFYDKKVTISMPDESNIHYMVQLVTELNLDDKHIDIEVKTPYETNLFQQIPIPLQGISRALSLAYPSISGSDPQSMAVCHVTPDRVRQTTGGTIEEVRYPHCETVLVMDCSRRDTLAITSRPAPGNTSKQIVTIATEDRTIEVSPDADSVLVRVDGSLVAKHPEVTRFDGDGKRSVSVRQLSDGRRVEVILEHRRESVVSDGVIVSIKVPRVQLPTVCGVCGSVRSASGLLGPDQVEYTDPDAFLSSYLVPSNHCDATAIQARLGVPERRQESKLVRPSQRTDVKHMIQNGIPKTCFSTKPISECQPNTIVEKTENKVVAYVCVRSSSPLAEKYLEISRLQVLDEVRDRTPSIYEPMIMPQVCIAN